MAVAVSMTLFNCRRIGEVTRHLTVQNVQEGRVEGAQEVARADVFVSLFPQLINTAY